MVDRHNAAKYLGASDNPRFRQVFVREKEAVEKDGITLSATNCRKKRTKTFLCLSELVFLAGWIVGRRFCGNTDTKDH